MVMLRLIVAGLLALSLIAFPAIAAEKKAASGGYGMMDTQIMEQQKIMQDMMGMMKEVMGILKDLNHFPSAEQKKKLEEMMKKADDIVKKHDQIIKKKMEKKMDKGGGY